MTSSRIYLLHQNLASAKRLGRGSQSWSLYLTNPVLIFLQLIKEKLLDLLGKEEDEGSHDENVVRAACVL